MRRAQATPPRRKAAPKAPKEKRLSGDSVGSEPRQQPTDDIDDLNIVPDGFIPYWTYTIFPRTKK